ncbi:hypothetical protein QAD02_016871 [Eretmocerus hayati]|uniref:Uncharacterized protein n=1 Tax=Eretmocerus hayati TaxID=131215 RepID=A0ACC2PBT6_9HYME|nr:hypothetical protein QAD02_016871 [Eretmocerus hayati]
MCQMKDQATMFQFFVVLVVLTSSSIAYREPREILSKVIQAPKDTMVLLTKLDMRNDKGFIYGTCDLQNKPDEEHMKRDTLSEVNCTLHLVTPSKQVQKCLVHLKTSESMGISYVSIYSIGERKVIVESKELDKYDETHLHFKIVDLKSCAVQRLDYPSGIFSRQYIDLKTSSDKFHLLVKGSIECGYFTQCRITFDQNGKEVGEVLELPTELSQVKELPPLLTSSDKGRFMYGESNSSYRSWRAIYIDENGNRKVVADMFNKPDMTSNAGDLYGLCELNSWSTRPMGGQKNFHEKLQCIQYDWKTDEVVNITVDGFSNGREDVRLKTVAFENLRKGKFLFATVECDQDFIMCNTFHVSAVNSTGQVVNTTSFSMNLKCYEKRFDFDFSLHSKITQVEDNYCFNFRCFDRGSYIFNPNPVSFYSKCVAKDRIEDLDLGEELIV